MLRISHYLRRCAAGAVALLAQPALAQTHSVRSHHAYYRHHYYDAAAAYGRRDVGATLNEVATSPFYGQFGGYEDAHAAWQYSGPNQRHYFGSAWDQLLATGHIDVRTRCLPTARMTGDVVSQLPVRQARSRASGKCRGAGRIQGFHHPRHAVQERGQYQTAGTIEREIGGVRKEHRFIRADAFAFFDDAVTFTLSKARQMVDLQGERTFV